MRRRRAVAPAGAARLTSSGTAKSVSGATVHGRHLLRLRDANSGPVCEADAAIIRDDTDLNIARERGFGTAFVFDARSDSDFAGLDTLVCLDGRFGYLAAGDVIAFDPASRRFRVLFRRASKHNSFLVTERCNHYCLMCSQPPRDSRIFQAQDLAIDDFTLKGICAGHCCPVKQAASADKGMISHAILTK